LAPKGDAALHFARYHLRLESLEHRRPVRLEDRGQQAKVLDPHERRGQARGRQLLDHVGHLLEVEGEPAVFYRSEHPVETELSQCVEVARGDRLGLVNRVRVVGEQFDDVVQLRL